MVFFFNHILLDTLLPMPMIGFFITNIVEMLNFVCILITQVAKWLTLIQQVDKIIPPIFKHPFDSECLIPRPWVIINMASVWNSSRWVSLSIECHKKGSQGYGLASCGRQQGRTGRIWIKPTV